MENEIIVDFWGDFACFTRPESKVERLTYPVPTPSAIRGALSAIYSKPKEFYWQVIKIEVLNPISYTSFKRNEVIKTVRESPILVEEERTQRNSIVLRDVKYRVHAQIVKRQSFSGTLQSLVDQANRRINHGKCFYQPYLGCREFVAYFEKSDQTQKPVDCTLDIALMVYDVFDLNSFEVTKKCNPYISLFEAKLINGILEIPPYDSDLVLKPGVK